MRVTADVLDLFGRTQLENELAVARREVARLLDQVRDFTTLAHDAPWVHLDDLLGDLRAAATTVAVLEGVVARALE